MGAGRTDTLATQQRNRKKDRGRDMTTDEMASETYELIMRLLADGGWHSQRQILGDLIRTSLSEYAIKSVLRGMRTDPLFEAEDRRNSYRHSPSWWYRIRGNAGSS
jgi:hypothetical protein